MSEGIVEATKAAENGQPDVERISLPRPLVQAMLDVIVRMPAGDVYMLLRQLDEELGLSQNQLQPQQVKAPA